MHRPELRRDAEAASRLGISVKRFYGWEPKQVTEYVLEDGRLVRSVTTRESEWDDEERGNVLALLEYERQLCSGCGGYLPETTDKNASYTAGLPVRCYRCDVIQSKQDEYKDQPNPGALVIWPVEQK